MPYHDTLTGWRQVAPPPSASRVYYSYRIMVPSTAGILASEKKNNYKVIGTFQNFNPTSTRQVVRVRGIANNGGYPLELVPGPADTSINVTYLSLYLLPLNEALGYNIGSAVDLNRQRISFDIQELCIFPFDWQTEMSRGNYQFGAPINLVSLNNEATVEVNHYVGCYLSNIGRTINQGTVTIAETATIQVQSVAPTGFPNTSGYGVAEYNAENVFAGGMLE